MTTLEILEEFRKAKAKLKLASDALDKASAEFYALRQSLISSGHYDPSVYREAYDNRL
jgi:hypothetical protein